MSDAALLSGVALPPSTVKQQFDSVCYHCQLPVPVGANYQLEIEGIERLMCCPGCVAGASMILSAKLTGYYQYRDICDAKEASVAVEADQRTFEAYGKPDYMQQYCRKVEQGIEVDLIISGIRCAACVWLLEKFLSTQDGVINVSVNLGNHRAYITFDSAVLDIPTIFTQIAQLGYQAFPYVASIEENLYQQQKRTLLKALGVAGIGVMQVMMFTIALYAGAFEGMNDLYKSLLRWSSLLVATPVVLYSARLFFANAWRDIRRRRAGMDLPVSLAIGAAYVASLVNTVWLGGEVYFESVSMFTFFLLASRYIELTARQQHSLSSNALVCVFPDFALRYEADGVKSVLLNEIQVGDRVLVENGATVAADGLIESGFTKIDESAFSGESLPLKKGEGEQVFAGSVNVQNPFDMTVTALPNQSLLSNMVRLAQRAATDKPIVAQLADKVAGYFVLLVLAVALLAAVYWYFVEPAQVFAITLAVLVVSCPCALSLATPVALSVANKRLMNTGIMPTTGSLLTGLAEVDTVLFDKTGTLTDGKLKLQNVLLLGEFDETKLLQLAKTLESGVSHPLAKALNEHCNALGLSGLTVNEHEVVQGSGVSGIIEGTRYFLGNETFIVDAGVELPIKPTNNSSAVFVLLSDESSALGWFVFTDMLRDDAFETVSELQQSGKTVHMISGDSQTTSQFVADCLAIDCFEGGMKPQDKINHVQSLIKAGKKVLMVGDGINDAAALKQANVSIAMNNASEFVQAKADGVMLTGKLGVITDVLNLANKTRFIISQNIFWALCYNICALPLAFMGYIPPWLAALGMSASSLVVLLNSYRLNYRLNRLKG